MSIEVTRLDCVRGASIESATAAIVDILQAHGWALVPAGGREGDGPRRLALYVEAGWLVVVEHDRFAEEPSWATELSRTLGGSAVCLRAHVDFDALDVSRFEDGTKVGHATVGEDTPRDDDEWVTLRLPFLGDFAPEGRRDALARGIEVGRTAHEMAIAIAKAAGLPRPLGTYDLPPTGATELVFLAEAVTHEPAPAAPRSPGRLAESPDRHVKVDRHAEPSADELAAFASFLGGLEAETPATIEARQVRSAPRPLPRLPGRLEDDAAFDNYLGRAWAVGRVRWDGEFATIAEEVLGIAIDLADGLVENFGDDVIGLDLQPHTRSAPVRVGGPLATSTTARGQRIWDKVREHLASGARLRARGVDFHLEHTPQPMPTASGATPCPVLLGWSVPLPPQEPMIRALSGCLDGVVRRAARDPHVVEALVLAQERPGELAYPRMTGLWATRDRHAWREHVASPGWRLFVPEAGARKLRSESLDGFMTEELAGGRLVASTAESPFTMSIDDMNRLASHLLPAIGTKSKTDR